MSRMHDDKKEYLKSYSQVRAQIRELEEKIQKIRIAKALPSQPDPDYIDQLEKLEAKLIKKKKEKIQRYSGIYESIEKMQDETEKTVLMLHYLRDTQGRGMYWGEIADSLGYSVRQIHRIHSRALEHFEKEK